MVGEQNPLIYLSEDISQGVGFLKRCQPKWDFKHTISDTIASCAKVQNIAKDLISRRAKRNGALSSNVGHPVTARGCCSSRSRNRNGKRSGSARDEDEEAESHKEGEKRNKCHR